MADKIFSGHVQMKVQSAVDMSDSKLVDWFGGPASEVREELDRLKTSGRVWLLTEGCNNFDETTGECLGH